MLVADAIEYERVLSFRDDRHILQTLLDSVAPGDSYWEVGASIGLYSVLLAQAVGESGQVLAFEPEERSLNRLVQNVALNNLSNIRPLRIALGRDRNRMKLRVSQRAFSGTHSLVMTEAEVSESATEVVEVDVFPGDEFRRQEQLEIPTTIKVDVEGAEEEVLAGLKETLQHPNCRTVVCEIHFAILESRGLGEAPNRIEGYLQNCGFNRTAWLDHSHLVAFKGIL
jgi:FkbM family methyltransferase